MHMLCERCKIREANIQYTEVINGKKTDHHFCAQCAKEMDFGQVSSLFDGEFPLARLLSGLLGGESSAEPREQSGQITCPTCGMTYEAFVRDSQFGCADCYSVFDPLIHDNIKQLQGSDSHKGKRPVYMRPAGRVTEEEEAGEDSRTGRAGETAGVPEQINLLERKLHEALRMEEYEQAAVLRDQIRALKGEQQG